MIDTIKLRLYGILDTKDSTLDHVKNSNAVNEEQRRKPVFASTANNALYRAILTKREKNSSLLIVYNRETNSWENMSEEEFTHLENSPKISNHYQVRQKMRFIEDGQVKDINMKIRGKYRLTSSSPDVVFSVNENGSYIDFEFSIPKYLYGHNLAEFVPQGGSKLKIYDPQTLNSFAGQRKYLFKRLDYFIEKFLWELCGFYSCEELPDMNYLEVRRIDLCYNQYFNSKEDALMILNEQRKINLKRQRKNANIAKSYDTSISYLSSTGSYFKIYHKGSEYSKVGGDLKKHLEINKQFIENKLKDHKGRHLENYQKHQNEIWQSFKCAGEDKPFTFNEETKKKIKDTVNKIYSSLPYKVDFLKKEMDKVLRYEVSLSGEFFSSQYKRYIYRSNEKRCPLHNELMGRYMSTKNKMDNRTKEEPITPFERKNHKMFHDFLNRSISLVVGETEQRKRIRSFETTENTNDTLHSYKIERFPYRHTILGSKDVGLWSEQFLNHCCLHFEKLVKHYQIKKIQPFDEIRDRIKSYNDGVDDRRDAYNALYHEKTKSYKLNDKGQMEVHQKKLSSGKIVKKATELLTQTELREMKFKKVNETLLTVFLKAMEQKSLDEVFEEFKTPGSKRYRIRHDLSMFGVYTQTLRMERDINLKMDYKQYYWRLQGLKYRNSFFSDPHLHYKMSQYKFKIKQPLLN